MGATCSGQSKAFIIGSSSYPVKVLLLGTTGVGKTHLLNQWLNRQESSDEETERTKHFNVGVITSPTGLVFMIYDLAGNIGYRLRPFLDGTEVVLFMISKSDKMTNDESNLILQLSKERDLMNATFLFVNQSPADSNDTEKLQNLFEGRHFDTVTLSSSPQESRQNANLVLEALDTLVRKYVLNK